MNQQAHDLFSYPQTAGYKVDGTSKDAAESINAAGLRAKVLRWLEKRGNATADECAACLNLTPFSVRPRFTELKRLGKIAETGLRRPNASGRSATVWTVRQ